MKGFEEFSKLIKELCNTPFRAPALSAPRVEFSKKYAEKPVAPDKLINKTSNGWNSEFDYSSNLLLPLQCDCFQNHTLASSVYQN